MQAKVIRQALPPVVILAAGDSTRFWPLSTNSHKAMTRLCGQPVLEHTLRSVAAAGAKQVIIIQSPKEGRTDSPHVLPEEYFGSGSKLGLRLQYVTQPEATGPGDALLLAAAQLPERFFVIQPENINAGEILEDLLTNSKGSSIVAAQEREETWLFGVFALKNGKVTDVVEKPAAGKEPSKLVHMGIALLDQRYLSILQAEPSHPYSTIFALKKMAQRQGLGLAVTEQPFFPLKYPWHLFAMRDYLLSRQAPRVSAKANVAKGARLEGNVVLEAGTKVASSAIIKGPAYIGADVIVDEFTILRPRCVIEQGVTLRPYTDLYNTLVGAGTRIHRSYLANSILGEGIWIDANLAATNSRLDGGDITVDVKGHTIHTELQKLGTVVGHRSRFDVNVTITPGVMVGSECEISANTVVTKNLPDKRKL